MNPLSAIGLVADILQLLDFGSKLLISGYETYRSKDGMNVENAHIVELVNTLQLISLKLEKPANAVKAVNSNQPAGTISEHQAGLRDLARKSQVLAKELLQVLERVKGKSTRFRTWDAVRASFSASWNKDGIQSMRNRLMEIQILMNTRLLGLIQSDQMLLGVDIRTAIIAAGTMHQENLTKVTAAEDNVISTIQSLGDQLPDRVQHTTEHYDSEHQAAVKRYEESLAKLTSVVNGLSSKLEDTERTSLILASLAFSEMDERYRRIDDPCEGTFQWIFDEDVSPLPEWLRSGTEIFLISGKVGCGKSTMMKNIFDEPKTQSLLQQWAHSQGRSLVTANFFFWNSGSSLRKTSDGLLRSLLIQTLTHCHELVPVVLSQRWNSEDFRLSKPWTHRELSDAFVRLSGQDGVTTPCYCFFVDGLDEYQGQPRDLVKDLHRLIDSPYIKICATSRPRNVFDNAFGGKSDLILHEYTSSDMRTFVEKRLLDDPAFKHLIRSNPEATHIVARFKTGQKVSSSGFSCSTRLASGTRRLRNA